MDPHLTEVSQRFKAAFVRKDFDVSCNLLSQLKPQGSSHQVQKSPTSVREYPECSSQELTIARNWSGVTFICYLGENHCIKYAVELEKSFMEGAYNRVYFMDLFAKTIRNEIGGCSEKAYDHLSISDARGMVLFSSDQELLTYVNEEQAEWEVKDGLVVFQKGKESSIRYSATRESSRAYRIRK